MNRLLFLIAMLMTCSSCASLNNGLNHGQEFCKTIWGSSTRVLQEQRANGISKTYNQSYWDCVRKGLKVIEKQKWVIFQKNEIKGYVVVMGVSGNVNTTEVGIFFEEISDNQVRIDISSLSTTAKRRVAQALFHGLDIAFGYVKPTRIEKMDDALKDQEAKLNQ